MTARPAVIDTHCHLDVDAFEPDRRTIIERARIAGVSDIVVPAIRRDGWERLLRLCESDASLHPALGLHPVFLEQHDDEDIDALERSVARRRPVAVGEIGLDFYINDPDRGRQSDLCAAQLDIAARYRLPVLLHVRKAHDQMIKLLRDHPVIGGIAHAFNGSMQQAEHYISLGFKLGFGGMVTYPRSRKLRNLAVRLPMSSLVLETDAPDMAPESHHRERNRPEWLPETLAVVAALRGVDEEEIAARTTANARAVLGI
jgi:TatD DNase family protein